LSFPFHGILSSLFSVFGLWTTLIRLLGFFWPRRASDGLPSLQHPCRGPIVGASSSIRTTLDLLSRGEDNSVGLSLEPHLSVNMSKTVKDLTAGTVGGMCQVSSVQLSIVHQDQS
jgi:hypothetical protein